MKRYITFLEKLYDDYITDEYDRIVPIVGDEGMGKSTLILQTIRIWQDILDLELTAESVLDQVVWDDRNEFKTAVAETPPRRTIPVNDAARVLHKKEAMFGDQVDLEKDLLDVRVKENLFLLGFQEWNVIPTMLQKRRAKNLIYIPKRGTLHGYSRSSMDEKLDMKKDEWPEPDLVDVFPSLEGKKIWREFQKLDYEHKQERMKPDEEEVEIDIKEMANDILENGDLEDIISIHGGHNKPYIDAGLIEIEYDINSRQAKLIKKLLAREVSLS